ncbi:F-box domain-containing protein [Favolaschia claudopus]|uniref:F-box domain-containing protein n=1 Tax=Favolaschia claudopus TaxID=2862362 RepID=A0AAW0EFW6_9AGAR
MSTAALLDAALRRRISELTSRIVLLRQILEDAEGLLDTLKSQLNSLNDPVLALPPEIASEIFVHCLPTETFGDVVNISQAPLLLTHVCRAWRHIAISLPALWTTFNVTLKDSDDLPRLSYIAQIWFKRSKTCPLRLKIGGLLQYNKTFRSFAKLFQNHSYRIRSLALDTGGEDLEMMQSRLSDNLDLTSLQKLFVRLSDDYDTTSEGTIEMFASAPKLHEAVIRNVLPSFLILPWQQLTTLTVEMLTITCTLDVLKLTPNLMNCSLSAVFDDMEDPIQATADQRLSWPDLQALILFKTTGSVLPSSAHILFDFITLPALQTLKISETDGFEAQEFDSFLERSCPPLEELVLHLLHNLKTSIILSPSFNTLPLVELELWNPARDFIVGFFPLLHRDDALPQLETICFMSCCRRAESADDVDIPEILQSAAVPITRRWETVPGCAKLWTFHVVEEEGDDSSRYPEEDMIPFKRLWARALTSLCFLLALFSMAVLLVNHIPPFQRPFTMQSCTDDVLNGTRACRSIREACTAKKHQTAHTEFSTANTITLPVYCLVISTMTGCVSMRHRQRRSRHFK